MKRTVWLTEDGPAKHAVLEFVANVTREGGPSLVGLTSGSPRSTTTARCLGSVSFRNCHLAVGGKPD